MNTRRILYNLKRRYGSLVTYLRILSEQVNPDTGLITKERQKFKINRAIRLPHQITLGILDVDGKIQYGGIYEKGSRRIVIDGKDLPSAFVPEASDYLIFDD